LILVAHGFLDGGCREFWCRVLRCMLVLVLVLVLPVLR